jgi:hypothetical protein
VIRLPSFGAVGFRSKNGDFELLLISCGWGRAGEGARQNWPALQCMKMRFHGATSFSIIPVPAHARHAFQTQRRSANRFFSSALLFSRLAEKEAMVARDFWFAAVAFLALFKQCPKHPSAS